MSDLSLVDDDETEIPGGDNGESDEGQNAPGGDEGEDSGEEDGAGEEGDGEEGGQEEDVTPPPRRGRASESVREAKREAKEQRERSDRLERELAEIRAAQNAPRQPTAAELAAEAAAEQERLALMAPHEQVQYLVAKEMNKVNAQMHHTRLQLAEQSDRSSFEALKSSNPLARKYAADVEKVVSDQKGRGFTVDRVTALKHVLGDKMFEQASRNAGKAKKAGASRIAAAQGRPGRAAGEQGSDRGGRRGDDSIEALERRLKGVTF